LKATCDSESEFEEEVDIIHVCFMANENTPKLTPKITLDDCELSIDELSEFLKNFQATMVFSKLSI